MPDPKNVLQLPDFRLLFFTRFSSALALQVQAVIVGWQVYQLRPDPLLLGLLGLTEAIPAISASFFSGHIVDVNRPAFILRLSLAALFLNTCLIFSGAISESFLSVDQRLYILFLGIFISGGARSFTSPAIFSLIPSVVPRNQLSAAAAWNSSSYQFASIFGPAVGGLSYGFLGTHWAFGIPPVLLFFSMGSTFFLSSRTQNLRSLSEREPFWKSLRSGVNFAIGHRLLLSTMLLDMFSVLFGGAVAVLPMYSDQVLHAGSTGLGLLRAAPSVGSVIVGLVFAVRPMKVISGHRLLWAVAGFGATTLAFGFTTSFVPAFIFLALSGAFDGVSMVIRSTILQLLTPESMRGRVSALSSIFITSSNEIGAFESGLAARALGLIPSILFGGAMTIAIVGATAGLFPELRRARITSESDDLPEGTKP